MLITDICLMIKKMLKVLDLEKLIQAELLTLKNALTDIHNNTEKFVLFEMLGDYKEDTLVDILEIMECIKESIHKK